MAIVQLVFVVGVEADAYYPVMSGTHDYMYSHSGIVISEESSWHGVASHLTTSDSSDLYPIQSANTQLCESDTTSPCSASAEMDSTSILPVCEAVTQTNCIVTMSLGTSVSNMQQSTFIGNAPGPTLKGDQATGLIAGSTVGYWTNPLLNSSGTNTYLTNVNLYMNHDYANYACNLSMGRSYGVVHKDPKVWKVCNVSASILPYSVKSGNYPQHSFQSYETSNGQKYIIDVQNDNSCVWTTGTACDVLQDFAPGTIASMTLRLSNDVGGWFRGRLQNPSLTVSAFDKNTNLITIEAQSVSVPRLNVVFPSSSTDPSILLYCSHGNNCSPGIYMSSAANNWQAFTVINDLRGYVKDSASGVNTEWSFGSYAAATGTCLTNTSSILGIVTTNSMAYDSTVPMFVNGEATYGVAGMHYMPDGVTPFKGVYDMVMADSVARCLYNFSTAPISGSVTVTDDSGVQQNIATTSVSDIGGWLHLSAYNFLFSNPTITMKLTQASAPTTTTTIKKVAIKTITCVKGKLSKKVTGTSPKCPSGYALKK